MQTKDVTIDQGETQKMIDMYYKVYLQSVDYGELEVRIMARKAWIDQIKKNNRRNKKRRLRSGHR